MLYRVKLIAKAQFHSNYTPTKEGWYAGYCWSSSLYPWTTPDINHAHRISQMQSVVDPKIIQATVEEHT
jgi:hypothetical protein